MFCEILKQCRTERNLTQAELARRLGIGRDLYNKYEKSGNRPSYEILVALARELNVSVDFLLENDISTNTDKRLFPVAPDERLLLEKFRKLPPEKRAAIETLLE